MYNCGGKKHKKHSRANVTKAEGIARSIATNGGPRNLEKITNTKHKVSVDDPRV